MTGTGERRRGMQIRAAAVLAAVLAVAGCAAGVPPTVTPAAPVASESATPGIPTGAPEAPPGRVSTPFVPAGDEVTDAELVDFGERLTEALESGDVEQWLSYFEVDEETVAQQRDWFAAVRSVPMDVRELHPTSRHGPDGAVVDVDGEWAPGERVEFGFRHQVVGADLVPSVQSYDFLLRQSESDGGLRITEVAGTEDAGDYPQLWDVGAVDVTESDHLVLLADPADGDLVRELLPGLEAAAADTLAELPVDGVDRMVVTLTSAELVATLFGEGELEELAGFAMPLVGAPEVGEYRGLADLDSTDDLTVRLVLDVQYTADELDSFGEDVPGGSPLLRHEALHLVMLLRHVEGAAPMWASEGMAGWFEIAGADAPREELEWWYGVLLTEAGLPTGLPPSLWITFHGDDPFDVDRHYMESAMVFRYVEETYGYDATLALGDQLHAISMWDREDVLIDEALREHLGVGREEFVAGWLGWVAEQHPDAAPAEDEGED